MHHAINALTEIGLVVRDHVASHIQVPDDYFVRRIPLEKHLYFAHPALGRSGRVKHLHHRLHHPFQRIQEITGNRVFSGQSDDRQQQDNGENDSHQPGSAM